MNVPTCVLFVDESKKPLEVDVSAESKVSGGLDKSKKVKHTQSSELLTTPKKKKRKKKRKVSPSGGSEGAAKTDAEGVAKSGAKGAAKASAEGATKASVEGAAKDGADDAAINTGKTSHFVKK